MSKQTKPILLSFIQEHSASVQVLRTGSFTIRPNPLLVCLPGSRGARNLNTSLRFLAPCSPGSVEQMKQAADWERGCEPRRASARGGETGSSGTCGGRSTRFSRIRGLSHLLTSSIIKAEWWAAEILGSSREKSFTSPGSVVPVRLASLLGISVGDFMPHNSFPPASAR